MGENGFIVIISSDQNSKGTREWISTDDPNSRIYHIQHVEQSVYKWLKVEKKDISYSDGQYHIYQDSMINITPWTLSNLSIDLQKIIGITCQLPSDGKLVHL